MQPVSDRFLVAVKESGNRICIADLYYNRMKVPIVRDLRVISGSITIDSGAAQRRSGTLTLANTELISLNAQQTLEPYGLEIGIRIGVQYPDGDLEFVSIGIFQITQLDVDEETGGLPVLTLVDRSHWMAEQSSKTGVEDYSGKSTFFAITDLLTKTVFNNVTQFSTKQDPAVMAAGSLALVVNPGLTDIKIPGGTPMDGGSFWDDIQTLATSLGAEIFFDADGTNVILQPVPSLDNTVMADRAVLTIQGGPQGTLIGDAKGVSRIGAYNAVQMTGALPANAASTASPPTVFVYDADPNSPTFYDVTTNTNSGFGRIVFQTKSDTITDIPTLQKAAVVLLKKGLGLTKTLSISMLPNPALDVGDIINVIHQDGSNDIALADQITIDLAGGPMAVGTICPNQVTAFLGGNSIVDAGGGGGTVVIPPPPIATTTRHTKTYVCSGLKAWSQSYLNNGAQTSGSNSAWCYHGNSNAGDGNRMSMIGFDYLQIVADLAGSSIVSCSLYLYFEHWWYPSGGTAYIGTHNTANGGTDVPPNSWGFPLPFRVVVPNWPNPGSKNVSLGKTIGENFRDGFAKGLTLGGPNLSNSKLYYGYAAGDGTSRPPKLTFVYDTSP